MGPVGTNRTAACKPREGQVGTCHFSRGYYLPCLLQIQEAMFQTTSGTVLNASGDTVYWEAVLFAGLHGLK